MLAYYGTQISPHMTDTPEGYLICRDVRIARTGEMTYSAAELRLPGDPDRPVTVRRSPEDVFDPDAVASFEGKDVTAGHPTELLSAENHAAYAKGHVQNVRRDGGYLVADLLIKDAALISDIRNKVIREVSCGYQCRYVPDGDGYRQTEIRGNHVAIVPRGRAGHEVAIQDAAENAGKGKSSMNKFVETILKAFSMAAHEAESQEEVEALIPIAAAALDAEPAAQAQEAEPAVPAADAEPVPSPLEAKMDKIIGLLEALDSQKQPPEETTLDTLLEELEGKDGGAEPSAPLSGEARDAAMAILKSVRPAVAAIKDTAVRRSVTDALINAVKDPDALGNVVRAAQQSAQNAADEAGKTSFEQICAEQKAAYDARNPHKKQEG